MPPAGAGVRAGVVDVVDTLGSELVVDDPVFVRRGGGRGGGGLARVACD